MVERARSRGVVRTGTTLERLACATALSTCVSLGCSKSSSLHAGDGGTRESESGVDAGNTGAGGAGSGSGGMANAGGSRAGAPGTGGRASAGGNGGAPGAGGAAATAGGATGAGGTAGNQPAVRIVGRTDGNAASPRFEWSGVSMQARFKGTSVAVDLDGGNQNFFEVVIDGQVKPRIATTAGRKKISLATGLQDAEHELVLWRRSEADNYAPSQFFGFDFGGGTLLPSPPPPHKLEVIGDSITCGYGNEGQGPNCGFSFDTENSYLAYGSVAARELDADLYTECWSGKGVYQDRDGKKTDQIPDLFQRTIPTEAGSRWNFSYVPEAVVIDLGTNDFAPGDPGAPFVEAYENFVATLRSHYPDAFIFLVIGPMTSNPDLDRARGYLDQVVKARGDAGDSKVAQIKVDPQDQANGLGCDWHPSTRTDDIMGKAVAQAIRAKLGW